MLYVPKHRERNRGAGNARLPPTTRLERSARRTKADVERNPLRRQEHQQIRLKNWLGILVLAPVCMITALAVIEMSWRMLSQHDILSSEEFRFFFLGILGWTASYTLAGLRPVQTYVLGHELSHYLMAKATGARVYAFHFSAEGGYVDTDKSNTLISLAPYLLPIYSIAVLIAFGVLALFVDLGEPLSISAMGHQIPFQWGRLMFLLLGVSWAFHVTYTYLTLRYVEQSDLTRNGEFFSLMLIFAVNAILLLAMFVVTSSNADLGLRESIRCWWGTARWLIPGL